MLDPNNNTAGNNGAEEQGGEESPQSILEKRLAEINSRSTEENNTAPGEEENSAGGIIGGAVAAHEVIPPVAAVPLVGDVTEPNNLSGAESKPEPSGEVVLETEPGATQLNALPLAGQELNEPGGTAEVAPIPVAEPTASAKEPSAPAETTTPAVAATTSAETAIAETTVKVETGDDVKSDLVIEDEGAEDLVSEADYSQLPIDELRKKLLGVLKTATRKNSRQIFDMHRQYEEKLATERHDALQKFIADGASADDFEYHAGPAHQELEKAFQLFRENRNREQRQEEEQKIKNTRRKQELLEQLRELVESPETKSSSERIKAIQAEWKAIGAVPAGDAQQLWNSYHALLDIFYNNRSIFYELKELDRRKNLQHKVQLCERAEALVDNPSINTALQELRHLHEEWKNVGPVPNEFRDSIWDRFILASEKIHARKKDFITERKTKEQENLVKKQELLNRIEAFQGFQTDRINDWRDKTDEIQKLKEEWDSIGLVPKEKADEVNKRFWSSYKGFFNHKNAFFKSLDEQKMQNLRLKTELCEEAESLKDSTDWDETKEKLIQLQKKWKTIGRVPDKYSDKLWQRFRAACNEFFDRKQNQVQEREVELNRLNAEKSAYYEKVTSRIANMQTQPGSLEELGEMRAKWQEFPAVKGSSKLDERFYDLLLQYADSIPTLSNEEKNNLVVELQVNRLKQGPDASHKIHQKEQSIRKDIVHLENDIRTLRTNIEFFGRSKNADKLREEYQARIVEAEGKIHQLQRQLYAFRNA
ncbi:DUF349 domain-containing protein [Adhaeribacter aquaticus]|uniref:DUF349 domain-containing protein n=1 Tax=Adhaeribacter aquaticus TaxID=299567 RepID=UPI0003FF7768|nr:DUF349 domain-containing protein [Adhaeribacter aquaticus]